MTGLLASATVPDALTFAIAAVIVLAGALGVVFSRNPVHAALMLVMTLFGIAVLFVEEDAQFLAAVQVIVYAGAIVILFLFVIMLLGIDRHEQVLADTFHHQRLVAFFLGACVLAEVLLVGFGHWTTGAHSVSGTLSKTSNVQQLGESLFTNNLLAFEVTSALLVVAVVGAVLLSRRPGQSHLSGDGADRVAVDPPPTDRAEATDAAPIEEQTPETQRADEELGVR